MASVIGASSAALRKVMTNPLKRRKRDGIVSNDTGSAALSGDAINSIIEGEIIPRLLVAHSSGGVRTATAGGAEIDSSAANRFAALPLTLEAAGLLEEVDHFLEQGVSVDSIYLDLLAPAARRLGEMWETDECDFVDVTMGLWRLQEVMRDIAARSPPIVNAFSAPRSALFAPMPGDQHSFGAIMIEDVFARAGWATDVIPRPERRELLDVLSKRAFDLVGLTLSRDCPSGALAKLVKAVRGVSANPHISVLIGGRMINENPEIVTEVGADGTGADARAALEVAERLVLAAPAHAHTLR
ncbi:MAG: B12-binding domain-containing protein [Pseudomonadota bacterium]